MTRRAGGPRIGRRLGAALIGLGLISTSCQIPTVTTGGDIHKIKHVIVVMQENRSFDSYFGTFPGADGIPMTNGQPSVCLPDPAHGTCVRPFHDTKDVNSGGPHGNESAIADINGGRMDGFIREAANGSHQCVGPLEPGCVSEAPTAVMGYHDGSDIPNYWAYARNFALQDHMFESTASWSLPAHLYMVSEWSAACTRREDPSSCSGNITGTSSLPHLVEGVNEPDEQLRPAYAWTDLTYLFTAHSVSWRYYS